MESTVPDMTHTLLNFLLEAYSSFHDQALVTTIILAAIIVVATFVARSVDESQLKQVDKSLVFVSRPSQFNRFISMRCPSMSMNLSSKIHVLERADIEYQRICLHAPDGGIVAIDWPAELDFVAEEDHLANTLLLVPGLSLQPYMVTSSSSVSHKFVPLDVLFSYKIFKMIKMNVSNTD